MLDINLAGEKSENQLIFSFVIKINLQPSTWKFFLLQFRGRKMKFCFPFILASLSVVTALLGMQVVITM